ncbi:chaperone protein ClpB3, chloroplastic [Tanacetum coccineum]
MEKPLSDQAFASPYKVAEIVHKCTLSIGEKYSVVLIKLLHSLKKSKNQMVHGMVRGEFASPMARGLESKGRELPLLREQGQNWNSVYINLEGNRSHVVTTGWAMLGLIDAEQRLVLGVSVYVLWQERNLRTFQGRNRSLDEVCNQIKDVEVLSRKVLVDEGSRQVVENKQDAIWRFLWWSGTISVHVLVDQNKEDYSMKFRQVKPGFLKNFEGRWKVEPLLLDEAARIKGVSATESNIHQELSSNELKVDEITDDKERWALRRRKARIIIFLSKNSQRWHGKMSSPEVAKENKHQIRETEHLLKAILEQKNGLARRIFSKDSVDNTRLLEATDEFIQRQPKTSQCQCTQGTLKAAVVKCPGVGERNKALLILPS